jgi:hypothetical protein
MDSYSMDIDQCDRLSYLRSTLLSKEIEQLLQLDT